MASSGVTESATTPTIRGRGASTVAAGAAGSASAEARRPSPRTATAAMAVIPPIDEPTSATRRTPRSPRNASAPATSSTSSSPNVVGPSSDAPWPRKSRPSTLAVRRRNGPPRRGPARPTRCTRGAAGSPRAGPGTSRPRRTGLGRNPASHQADAVPGAEADDLAAQPVERRAQGRPPPAGGAAPVSSAGRAGPAWDPPRRPPGPARRRPAGRAASPDAASPRPSRGPRTSRRCSARRVNSVGIRYFVDGLAPSALSASRYCSVIVFSSISFAAP